MDIYQIFVKHNRPWSKPELLVFGVILLAAVVFVAALVHKRKIQRMQASAFIALVCFLGVVFASTVFTREPEMRQYELIPFWSWRKIFAKRDKELLLENLLNCILLFPAGCLFPVVAGRSIRPKAAYAIGFAFSAVIEVSQLIFCRGLFEWDDMIHNGLGCMVGCMIVNALVGKRKCKQH